MLEPRNRHVLVFLKEEEDQEEERAVLLPENYRKPQTPYAVVSVASVAPDVSQLLIVGDTLVVDRSMLKEVSVNGSTYHLILENYILGIINSEVK